MLSGKKTERSKFVDPLFVGRWADRYEEIRQKHGEVSARSWVRNFLNSEDVGLIMRELDARKGRRR